MPYITSSDIRKVFQIAKEFLHPLHWLMARLQSMLHDWSKQFGDWSECVRSNRFMVEFSQNVFNGTPAFHTADAFEQYGDSLVKIGHFRDSADKFTAAHQILILLYDPDHLHVRSIAAKLAVAEKSLFICSNCRRRDAKLHCSRCCRVKYCSKSCQVKSWVVHKTECKKKKSSTSTTSTTSTRC